MDERLVDRHGLTVVVKTDHDLSDPALWRELERLWKGHVGIEQVDVVEHTSPTGDDLPGHDRRLPGGLPGHL
jgi:hypothetical protein